MTGTGRGRVTASMRQDQALEKWAAGMTYAEVAEDLEYANRSGAYKAVQAALARHETEIAGVAEKARAAALVRLRPLWRAACKRAIGASGTSKDIMAAAHLVAQMARYEGYGAAAGAGADEVRLTVETELDRDIARLVDAMERAARAGGAGLPNP